MLKKGVSIVLQLLLLLVGTGATAQSVAELLEQGIYAEETEGNLDAAIAIYDKIVNDAEAERPYVARALFRQGQCFLKSGKKDLAGRTFEKLIAEYPDQAELVAQARQHLPEQPGAKFAVGPAPWEDGELLRYGLTAKSGEPVGDLTYSVRSETANDRKVWRMESRMALPMYEISKYSLVDFDQDDSTPINAVLYHTQLGTLRAEFTRDERRIQMNQPGEEPAPFTQKLDGATYDNEQAIHLIRRLPLADGYETSFVLTGRPGVTALVSLRVQGIETISVPAGTFECFKVEVGTPPKMETQWFSTDRHRYLVQVMNPEIVVGLTEITKLSAGPARYENEQAGFSLTAPRDWDIMKSAFTFSEHEFWILLFSPEMKVKAVMVSQKLDTPVPVREFADTDVDIYKTRRKPYSVREDSWQDMEVSGFPAVSLLANLEAENTKMLEYRVYIAGPSAYYWFVFRSEPDVLESMKSELDSIVNNLTFD